MLINFLIHLFYYLPEESANSYSCRKKYMYCDILNSSDHDYFLTLKNNNLRIYWHNGAMYDCGNGKDLYYEMVGQALIDGQVTEKRKLLKVSSVRRVLDDSLSFKWCLIRKSAGLFLYNKGKDVSKKASLPLSCVLRQLTVICYLMILFLILRL